MYELTCKGYIFLICVAAFALSFGLDFFFSL